MTSELAKNEQGYGLWSDFDRAFDELSSRFFEPLGFAGFGPGACSGGPVLRAARTDVADTGSTYRIVAEIPGIPKDKLDIRVRGSTVEIRGENGEEKESKGPSYVYRERVHQGYYRALELPEAVIASDAKAKVENGLLELELPKQHPVPTPDEVKVPVA